MVYGTYNCNNNSNIWFMNIMVYNHMVYNSNNYGLWYL